MLGHLQKAGEGVECKVCGKKMDNAEAHYVTGYGYVCRKCGLVPVSCDRCGSMVRRLTTTVLRGRMLCLNCYSVERESGEKRVSRELSAENVENALQLALKGSPEGFILIGLRLKPSSTTLWIAEYEREDIFGMRCS
jgi:recombinational DNA repair protein (RecF pathway)